jgi:hypothetical protein
MKRGEEKKSRRREREGPPRQAVAAGPVDVALREIRAFTFSAGTDAQAPGYHHLPVNEETANERTNEKRTRRLRITRAAPTVPRVVGRR